MIIFLHLIIIQACQQYHNDYYIYPIQGETIEMPLDVFFNKQDLKYDCPNCPENVTVSNVLSLIGENSNNYTFISVSFLNDQFAALTQNHTLNIYTKNINRIELERIISINQNLNCFNVIYTLENKILLDCYLGQQLYLYYLEANTLIQVYTSHSQKPQRTKISSFANQTKVYTVYGQFFEDQGFLTIFAEKTNNTFYNISKINGDIQDFLISFRGFTKNQLFVQFSNKIQVYILSSEEQLKKVYYAPIQYSILSMTYFYSIDTYYQFDRFIMITRQDEEISFQEILYGSFFSQKFASKNIPINITQGIQLFANSQFIILYNNNELTIFKNQRENINILAKHRIFSNEQQPIIYFNSIHQKLYIFGKSIQIYQISFPTLSFSSNLTQGSFIIKAHKIINSIVLSQCIISIHFNQISYQDRNIYPIYNNKQSTYYNILQSQFHYPILDVSGPLIRPISHLSNSSLGNFYDDTLQQTNLELQQNYQMIKIFGIELIQGCKSNPVGCFFIVAIQNQTIDIYEQEIKLISLSINLDGYSFNNSQVEINYFTNGGLFFYQIGLSINSTCIQIYSFLNKVTKMFISQNITLQIEPYKQFLLLDNAVVLILDSNQLAICTFDNKQIILLNSTILTKLFGTKILLNPINIFMNQQYQSKILYINNNNSFLIGSITDEYTFVLFSLKEVNMQIINLQVIKNFLILSYNCEDQYTLCFQVWNVKDYYYPKFLKNLTSIQIRNQCQFYSDNLFFYVQTENIINVYNPEQSEHSSLYKQITFNGQYFSSLAYENIAFLSFNQSLFSLTKILIQSFLDQNIQSEYFSDLVFNFTISSELNPSYKLNQTNNSLIIINNYIDINLEDKSLSVDHNQSSLQIYREDISTQGQIEYFQVENNNNIFVNNFIDNYNLTVYLEKYNLSTTLKNQFVLLNNQNLFIYNSNLSYSFGPYNICIATTTYQDIIYVLCQKEDFYQVISLNILNDTNLEQTQVIDFIKLNYSNYIWMKIQDDLLYIWNRNKTKMYHLNQNYYQNETEICECTQLSFQAITLQKQIDQQVIVYFYFKVYTQNQLSYKIIKIIKNQKILLGEEKNININLQPFQIVEFDTIIVLDFKYKEIFLMISNSGFNCIISILWILEGLDILQSNMVFQDIIQTSPPQPRKQFNLTTQPQNSSGLLLFLYSNTINSTNQSYLITLYNMSVLENDKKYTPLLYEGGYNFTLNSVNISSTSFYTYNKQQGEILILFDNYTAMHLDVNLFSIQVNLPQDLKKQNLTFLLKAFNYYNQSAEATIIIYQKQENISKGSFYALASLILIVILTAILVYYDKTRNYKEDQDLDYLEMEL
ncbi:unnamed protein product [Paramecium primaurelia]|uniref:Transmembrane protein n=1 Tax=Paramecium primaurelia TaxID=5886 RepID=A0A8S1MYH9_PARPR|nr:unnamed protein product [Paramecium primaurelia]